MQFIVLSEKIPSFDIAPGVKIFAISLEDKDVVPNTDGNTSVLFNNMYIEVIYSSKEILQHIQELLSRALSPNKKNVVINIYLFFYQDKRGFMAIPQPIVDAIVEQTKEIIGFVENEL